MATVPSTRERQDEFDPYYEWLGIDPSERRPISPYALLGLPAGLHQTVGRALNEQEKRVVDNLSNQRMAHVKTCQTGKYSGISQRILNELSDARITLLVDSKKLAYDSQHAVVEVRLDSQRKGVSTRVQHAAHGEPVPGIPAPHIPKGKPVSRPKPRPEQSNGNGSNGNGKPKLAVHNPVEDQPVDPPVFSPGEYSPSAEYKKRSTGESWFQKQKNLVYAGIAALGLVTVGGVAMMGSSGEKKSAEDGRGEQKAPEYPGNTPPPAQRVRPVTVQEDPVERPLPPPPVEVVPKPQPEQVAVATPSTNTPDNAPPTVDPAEQQRKQEEFNQKVRELHSTLVDQYKPLTAAAVQALMDGEEDPVKRAAQSVIVQQKQAAERTQQEYQANVRQLYADYSTQYASFGAAQILEAAKGEKDAKQTALCLLAASKAGEKGDIVTVNAAFGIMNDRHYDAMAEIRMKLNIVDVDAQQVRGFDANTRLRIVADLLRPEVLSSAHAEDNYDNVKHLLDTADEYLNGLQYNQFPTSQRTRAMQDLRDYRDRITAERQKLTAAQKRYNDYMAGLNAELQPKSPQASYAAAVYVVRKGSWAEGLRYLANCDNSALSAAASLDLDTRTTDPQKLYDLAKQWSTAAATAPAADKDLWYGRAAYLLGHAEARKPKGKLGLDISVLRGELESAGVPLDGNNTQVTSTGTQDIPSFPKGRWVNLDTSEVEVGEGVVDQQRRGRWEIRDNKIVQLNKGETAILELPYTLPEGKDNYDFSVVVNRQEAAGDRDHAISLSFPVGSGNRTSFVAGFVGKSGLSFNIDGKIIDAQSAQNPTAIPLDIPTGQDILVEISVRTSNGNVQVQVKLNGRVATSWRGEAKFFDEIADDDTGGIRLGCRTPSSFTDLKLRQP